eukprot:gene5637-210_t
MIPSYQLYNWSSAAAIPEGAGAGAQVFVWVDGLRVRMGNVCMPARRRYQVLAGDGHEQETTFNEGADPVQQAIASYSAQKELLEAHPDACDGISIENESPTEQTYRMATEELKLERSDSLENLLTCAICLDFLFDPVRSDCGHSFCLTCIRRLLQYEGQRACCPKCRLSLSKMNPDTLVVDLPLAETIQRSYDPDEVEQRREQAELDEKEYIDARAVRLRREHLMEVNPLQLMFESEEDPTRRRILRRDMALLTGMGFSEVMAQKALFVASGTHTEAISWLIHHQHHMDIDIPWNATQLQEQIALRNTRRVLCGTDIGPTLDKLLPNELSISVAIVRHVSILGRRAWMVSTRGFGALGMPELVFMLKAENEHCIVKSTYFNKQQLEHIPDDVREWITKVFQRAKLGRLRTDHGTVIRISSTSSFLGHPTINAVLLTREMGQTLQGLPLPHGTFVMCILLHGEELSWAENCPTRFLVQYGSAHRGNYPFSVINDLMRSPVFTEPFELRNKYLLSAMFINKSISMRVRNMKENSRSQFGRRRSKLCWFLVHLPIEAKEQIQRYVSNWTCTESLPLLTDLPLGADGFLLNQIQSTTRQKMLSLPNAAGSALGASGIVFVRGKRHTGTGGILRGDILMFHATDQHYQEILGSLSRGHDLEINCTSRALECGLRIKGNLGNGIVLPLIACETHEMTCPDMNPRINVLGIGIGIPAGEVPERVDEHRLERYICSVLESVNGQMSKLLTSPPHATEPSLITLHIDLEPEENCETASAVYRISKNYTFQCPQAPALSMRKWSRMLHPVPTPPVNGKVPLQISLELV